MSVIGEAHVRDQVDRGRRVVVVGSDDILTPQARELIDALQLEIVEHALPVPERPGTDPNLAVQRTLFRRSPRWMAPSPRTGTAPVRLGRVAIVGSGNVGATSAHLLATHEATEEIVLIDLVPGLAASVALDIGHAAGISGSTTRAKGATETVAVADADVVVITAGRPRSPGMDRSALVEVNGRVVRSVAEMVAEHAPNAVVIVVTNPLDEMTLAALDATSFPRHRVLGMAGTLDSARFRTSLARAAAVAPMDVEAFTLGSHGNEMVPVVSHARIKGRPLDRVLSPEVIEECVADTISGGAQVVALRRTGSAYVAPAHAIVEVLEAMRGARAGTIPVSVLLDGEYGISGVVVGVPTLLGPKGLIEVVELPLSAEEREALTVAAAAVAARAGTAAS